MKSYLLFFVSLFLIGGCASLEPPVIEVTENTYSSSKNPSVKIELPLDFKYLGHINKRLPGVKGMDYKIYIYANLIGDNFLQKSVKVSTQTLHNKIWSGNTHRWMRNPLKFNVLKVDSKKFNYSVKVHKGIGKFSDPFLVDKGIVIPTCIMSMSLRRVFPAQVAMFIDYFEDLSNYEKFRIDSCEDWREKELLNDKQMKYLEEFEQRALNSIKIY